jgi:hypothetical protein
MGCAPVKWFPAHATPIGWAANAGVGVPMEHRRTLRFHLHGRPLGRAAPTTIGVGLPRQIVVLHIRTPILATFVWVAEGL